METVSFVAVNGHNIFTSLCDVGSKDIVIFAHGYRGTSVGPNRFFVRAARKLADRGISSLRFDQYGSGNSEGDFIDSSFTDWIETTVSLAKKYQSLGYRVSLFGQSMGGSTVLCAGAQLPEISCIVSWVPDASIDEFVPSETGIIEESGQIVRNRFWQEAHYAEVYERLTEIKAPTYIVQCSEDEYISAANHEAIARNAQPNHTVEMFDGYKHSSWSYDASEEIINKSVDFIVRQLS